MDFMTIPTNPDPVLLTRSASLSAGRQGEPCRWGGKLSSREMVHRKRKVTGILIDRCGSLTALIRRELMTRPFKNSA